MAPEDVCESEVFVWIRWDKRKLAVPLVQLVPLESDEMTQQALADWQCWRDRGYQFGHQIVSRDAIASDALHNANELPEQYSQVNMGSADGYPTTTILLLVDKRGRARQLRPGRTSEVWWPVPRLFLRQTAFLPRLSTRPASTPSPSLSWHPEEDVCRISPFAHGMPPTFDAARFVRIYIAIDTGSHWHAGAAATPGRRRNYQVSRAGRSFILICR